jgi:amino acid transporter
VAAVDTGVVPYVTALSNNWFNTSLDPASHLTIFLITIGLLAIQTTLNIIGAKVMGRVAGFGTYVEILGTFGIAILLAAVGFHHGFGFLFTTQGAEHAATNPLGVDFHGSWWTGAALVAILAHVYIFYGFESAGDVAEETKDAARWVPRAMRSALIVGGITSFVLVAALLLATPKSGAGYAQAVSPAGGVPFILSSNIHQAWLNDVLLLVIFACFSCGSSVQGAGARLAFSYGRDGAVPGSRLLSHVSSRFRTPTYALLLGAVVAAGFSLLVNLNPSENKSFLFVTYPAKVSALTALVSFGVSGIYLSFLLTVIGAIVARARGWVPEGPFQLKNWGWPVTIIAATYLGLMLLNVVWPSGVDSPRAVLFNLDWVTMTVMVLIALVGLVVYLVARPTKSIIQHVHDELEPTGAERHGEPV